MAPAHRKLACRPGHPGTRRGARSRSELDTAALWTAVLVLARLAAKLPGLSCSCPCPDRAGQHAASKLLAALPSAVHHAAQVVAPGKCCAGLAVGTSNAFATTGIFSGLAACAAYVCRNYWTRPTTRRRIVLAAQLQMDSPFAEGAQLGKPKLPLSWENVEAVLEELRPYLQNDGGDCKILEIEGPIVHLEMQGSCSSCSSSAITLKNGIESTLLDRIPEIFEVIAEMPGSEMPTEEGVEKILGSIRPFLSVSGGSIELVELLVPDDTGDLPSITLGMTGPPQRNNSVKTEVIRRIRSMYAQSLIEIVGDEE